MLKCKTDLGFTTFYICPQPTIYMDLEFYINPHPRETDLGVLCFTAPKTYNGLYFFNFNPHSPDTKDGLGIIFYVPSNSPFPCAPNENSQQALLYRSSSLRQTSGTKQPYMYCLVTCFFSTTNHYHHFPFSCIAPKTCRILKI